MITVMGATGHTGKKIALRLLAAGEQVRALGRSEEKLAELNTAGAEVLTGDAADAAFLTGAFQGSDSVYTLLPTNPRALNYRARQDQAGAAIVQAIHASGVKFVVALSSIGADQAGETGLIAGLHAQEERLKKLKYISVLLLRPVFFYENFYNSLRLIKNHNLNVDAVASDLPIPMIAAHDIAVAAVQALRARDWKGLAVRDLLGPRDLTYSEATHIIGKHIGKPNLRYVQFPYGDEASALVQAGLSESFAELYVEMARAINEGRLRPPQGRLPENTTPTEFEDFANELAQAYRAYKIPKAQFTTS